MNGNYRLQLMKFIFIAPRFHTNFYYPIKTLLDHGHQVEFLALYEGKSESHDLVKPIIIGREIFWPILFVKVMKYLWLNNPDVLIIKDIVTPYSLIALTLGRLFHKKMLVMTQIPKFRAQSRSGAVRWLWSFFRTYAITPVLGEVMFSNKNKNLIYLPFIIPVNKTLSRVDSANEIITILCVGKFQARKNQLLLIKAVQQLRDDYNLKLILSGQEDEVEYLNQLKSYIKEHELESVVKIIHHRPWDQMVDLYNQSDLFVLPSYSEPASYSILEAMSYSLPVVSSDDNGTQWYIKPGQNGWVFKSNDLGDLTEKLKLLFGDRSQLKRMGEKSLVLVAENHNPETFYQKLMEIIN